MTVVLPRDRINHIGCATTNRPTWPEATAPAFDILRSDPEIDLLFTDLLMPGGMSGVDLVQRGRELLPHLKVLLTTGHAAEAENMIANIEEPILKKPCKKRQLAQAVRSVLERAA